MLLKGWRHILLYYKPRSASVCVCVYPSGCGLISEVPFENKEERKNETHKRDLCYIAACNSLAIVAVALPA